MEASTPSRRIHFGKFEVDPESGELFKEGRTIRLQGQPIQILLMLLEKPGRLVTREELQHRVWPTDTFVDFDHSLNAAIKRLRESLSDSADEPRYIETLPRRGYRFIHPVDIPQKEVKEESGTGEEEVNRREGERGKRQRQKALWGALVVMLLAGVGAAWFARLRVQLQSPQELRETRLTSNPSEYGVVMGCISPDGKYLAYSDRRGLYLKLIDTRDVHPIPQPEGLTAENTLWYAGYWFPDSSRFLAYRCNTAGFYSAWVVSVLGGPPHRLRDNVWYGQPSPDGSRIVYCGGEIESGNYSKEFWLMGAQGDNPRKFLSAAEGEGLAWPAWSPDGQRIAYMRGHGGETCIESRNLKGEQLTTVLSDPRFSAGGLYCLWWFPNGRMVFTVNEPKPIQNDHSLWEIQVDPKTGLPLSQPKLITKWVGIWAGVMDGTTDGKRLAILRSSVQADVFVGEWEGKGRRLKNPRRLTLDERRDIPSAWTSDSQAILFHSDRNGQFDIFKQALGQETAEPLVTGPGNKHDPVLSPDGNLILYLHDLAGGNTRIMRVRASGGHRKWCWREVVSKV